jgi:hypothetical protein
MNIIRVAAPDESETKRCRTPGSFSTSAAPMHVLLLAAVEWASINVSPRRKLDVEKEISADALSNSIRRTVRFYGPGSRGPHLHRKKLLVTRASAFYLVLHHFGFNLTAREGVNVILNLFVSDCEPLSTSIKNTLSVIALSEFF